LANYTVRKVGMNDPCRVEAEKYKNAVGIVSNDRFFGLLQKIKLLGITTYDLYQTYIREFNPSKFFCPFARLNIRAGKGMRPMNAT
jgi:hypothetical protein